MIDKDWYDWMISLNIYLWKFVYFTEKENFLFEFFEYQELNVINVIDGNLMKSKDEKNDL